MENWILFGLLSLFILIISWNSLFISRNHGFYRFFSFECIAWLMASNMKAWFINPTHLNQLVSWLLLVVSVVLVLAGFLHMRRKGKPLKSREGKALYAFEKTTELVDTGIFRYIRHPMYASLIFLTWGIYLKGPTLLLTVVAALSSIFLFLTALYDEKECIDYFGESYREYMRKSKRFIPFIL